MSPFALHKQHGLQAACEPTKLRKDIFSNVSYFILYTIDMPAPDLARSEILKINLFVNSFHKRSHSSSLSYICLMSPFTLHGQHSLQAAFKPTKRK